VPGILGKPADISIEYVSDTQRGELLFSGPVCSLISHRPIYVTSRLKSGRLQRGGVCSGRKDCVHDSNGASREIVQTWKTVMSLSRNLLAVC
jgi:hypothetical protein